MNNLIKRNCPACNSNNYSKLVEVSYSKLLKLNNTYVVKWFNENTIHSDFELPIVRCSSCDFVYSKYTLEEDLQFSYYHDSISEAESWNKIFTHQKRHSNITIWARLHSMVNSNKNPLKVLD
jgi:hypothetical protein